jgi:DNA-binding LytR/AlgR family response regulator
MGYAIMMTIAAILQRIFIHLFYENLLFDGSEEGLFSVKMLIRASVLINTTVFLVLSLKIFQLFLMEREKNNNISSRYIEIKADRRIHRISLDDILFVEGKGNYTTYNLSDHKKITAYGSIKKTMEILPSNFVRVHKSFVVNKNKIKSFDANTIQIEEALIPRGKSVKDEILFPR